MPTFSIITVVYNGAALLPGTIQSVLQQSYTDYEYLIIDGASRDGSIDIIRGFAAQAPAIRFISEKDKGLYDAMNKGLRMAKGDFVLFLNCGDSLHAPDTLQHAAEAITENTGVLYGDTLLVNDAREALGLFSELSTRSLPEHVHWRQYLWGMRVVHQSFFARRSLAPEYMDGNLCADYDWCIRILKKSEQTTRLDIIVSDYLAGGMSKQRHRQSLQDRFTVMRLHFGLPATLLAHAWFVVRALAHRLRRMGKQRY